MIRKLKSRIGPQSPLRLGWHFSKAFFAAMRYGFPARALTVIGITGTDGKTTTVSMTAHILRCAGIRCGALSTAFLQIGEETQWNATQKTSPSPLIVQRFLRDLRKAGCTHAVLECSSHGLVQGRTHYTWPKIAAITNTSAEHLDYHGTMEQYRSAKAKLFLVLKGKGTKVLNGGDGSFDLLTNIASGHTVVYGAGSCKREAGSDVVMNISDVIATSTSSNAMLNVQQKGFPLPASRLQLPIPGSFNLENALCAIGCALGAGIPVEKSLEALQTFRGVPGRLEHIDEGQPFAVFVDFTVTPAAYERTLGTIRSMLEPGRRILVLTGSCGDRMREKRPIVGKLCSTLADVVVVTNEDPYTEDPQKIIDEVFAGIDQSACEAHRIFDRREAMRFLFEQAQPGDIFILCAKGSDTTMWTAQGQIPWNEREIARELLRTPGGSSAS